MERPVFLLVPTHGMNDPGFIKHYRVTFEGFRDFARDLRRLFDNHHLQTGCPAVVQEADIHADNARDGHQFLVVVEQDRIDISFGHGLLGWRFVSGCPAAGDPRLRQQQESQAP